MTAPDPPYDPAAHPWRCGCGHELDGEPMTPPFKCTVEGCACSQCTSEPEDGNPDVDHDYTSEIVCPQCGDEWSDSWEVGRNSNDEDLGEQECDECGCKFYATRHIDISYCTTVITSKDREREAREKARQEAERLRWVERDNKRKLCTTSDTCPAEVHRWKCPKDNPNG